MRKNKEGSAERSSKLSWQQGLKLIAMMTLLLSPAACIDNDNGDNTVYINGQPTTIQIPDGEPRPLQPNQDSLETPRPAFANERLQEELTPEAVARPVPKFDQHPITPEVTRTPRVVTTPHSN